MVLAMARPWKHPKTGVYYIRLRVPSDLVLVVGREMQKNSLRTKNPIEARHLHSSELSRLNERWTNLRRGILKPSIRQAAGIAGTFYHSIAKRHLEGRYSVFGEPFIHVAALAFRDAPNDSEAHANFRRVFGKEIDDGLALLGMLIHPEATGLVDLAIARAVIDAQEKGVKVLFEGDHSPDPAIAKYPAIAEVFSAAPSGPHRVVGTLLIEEQFAAYAKAAQLALSTQKRWGLALSHLRRTVGHDDVARITPEDVGKWIDALRAGERSERTIRDVHLAALKALCNWLMGERKLATNPAAGFRIRVPKTKTTRSKGFTELEALKILGAALEPQSRRLGPKHALARRWIPWIAAYTGARVNELTQLRKEDVQTISGIAAIVITPEAGTVKTKEFRIVPLHPHLVEQGFLEVVRKSKRGPLFYDARPNSSAVTPPYKKLGERLGRWVRESGVRDTRVDPFHGWRHRFKTVGRSTQMKGEVLDTLQGHKPATEGGKYGEFEIEVLDEAIRMIPRYIVAGFEGPR